MIQSRYGRRAGNALAVEKGFGVEGGGADAQQRCQVGLAERKGLFGEAQILGRQRQALLRGDYAIQLFDGDRSAFVRPEEYRGAPFVVLPRATPFWDSE